MTTRYFGSMANAFSGFNESYIVSNKMLFVRGLAKLAPNTSQKDINWWLHFACRSSEGSSAPPSRSVSPRSSEPLDLGSRTTHHLGSRPLSLVVRAPTKVPTSHSVSPTKLVIHGLSHNNNNRQLQNLSTEATPTTNLNNNNNQPENWSVNSSEHSQKNPVFSQKTSAN